MSEQSAVQQIPWIDIEMPKMPSRGVLYPAGTKIRYRTYSFGEIKNASASSGAGPAIVQIIENTLRGLDVTGMEKDQITFLDCMYLGVLRKMSTLRDGDYEVPFRCTTCGVAGVHKFKEKDLDYRSLSEEVTGLPLSVEISGRKVDFGPLRVKEFLALQRGRYQKVIIGGEPDRVAMNALMITNLEFKDAYTLLFGLTDTDDIEIVEEVDQMLMHDIKPLKGICQAVADKSGVICNTENDILLQGREAIIRPFRAGDKSVRHRISVGVPRDS
jgi:hypothetical protein